MLESIRIEIAVSRPSRRAPTLTVIRIGCRLVEAENCSWRVNSSFTGRPVFRHGERDDVLGEHLLLAAEAAADALGENPYLVARQIEESAKRVARQKRRLRAGADMQPPIGVQPADRAMGLEMRVLHPLRRIDAFVDDVGFGEACLDVADMAVQFGDDVAFGVGDARGGWLVMQQGRARTHRLFGVEHRGQEFVDHLDQVAGGLRRRFAFGHHRRDALADEAHDRIEHQRVVGIVGVEFVPRGRETAAAAHPDGSARRRRPGRRERRSRRFARCGRKHAASAGFSCAAGRRSPRPSYSGRGR